MQNLPNVYNRFDAAKNYDGILFRKDKVIQSAELNEMQSMSQARLRGITDALFKDGDISRDARIIVNPDTGVTMCESGAVYLSGAMRGVAAATITIPVVGIVHVGLYMASVIVSEVEDPELLNPAAGTRGYQSPGALREQIIPVWGRGGDGTPGDFFPVWTVEDGYVRPKEPPPQLDAVTQALASYDRDSAGQGYIVSGFNVAAAANLPTGEQVYTVAEGRARVNGFAFEQITSRRLTYPAVPDLRVIDSEPHQSTTVGLQHITYQRGPAQGAPTVRITAQRTVNVLHGGFTGAADPLPDNSVIQIVSVNQGGTTYHAPADFKLTAGQVDWSPAGIEPAPGSNYSVTYQYIKVAEPLNVTPQGFDLEGALVGTPMLVTYTQMLKRIDRLCLDAEGAFHWVAGTSSTWVPSAPPVPDDMLLLASVAQSWDENRAVVRDGVKVVPMDELAGQLAWRDAVTQDLAEMRLALDINGRDSGIKKGIFADPFLDDSMRDAGLPQTAAITGGALRLPITAQLFQLGAGITTPQAPAHSYATALEQTLRTGSMNVNPYYSFQALPSPCTLSPNVDRWTEVSTQWTSAVSERLYSGTGNASVYMHTKTTTRVVNSKTTELEYLRPIAVQFEIKDFGPGEGLALVTFDDIAVVPQPLPAGTLLANGAGVLTGKFTIPAHVPAGTKRVLFTGTGGSNANQLFTGQGTAITETKQNVNTDVWARYDDNANDDFVVGPSSGGSGGGSSGSAPVSFCSVLRTDPLAQTFTTVNGFQSAGVDLWFTAKSTEVVIQIVEAQLGFPTSTIVLEKRLQPADIRTDGQATRVTWTPTALSGGREYALVVMADDPVSALAVAELGKWDATLGRLVTVQPYQVGVLLSSSNASTWTAHQDRDMAFRLLSAAYTEAERVIDLGSVDLVAATDLMVMGYADCPTADTGLVFELVFGTGEVIRLNDHQVVWLGVPYTGTVHLYARLRAGAAYGAVLRPGVQLVAGSIQATGNYISRTLNAGNDSRVKVVFDAEIPGGSSVQVHVQADTPAAPWVAVPYQSASAATAGVREIVHELPNIDADRLRVRVSLTGHTAARPAVSNLRAMVLEG